MIKDTILSSIDIGTSRLRAAMAHVDRTGKVQMLGIGSVPAPWMGIGTSSTGLWYRSIFDYNECRESFRDAIRQVEEASGIKMNRACVSISSCGEPISDNDPSMSPSPQLGRKVHPSDLQVIFHGMLQTTGLNPNIFRQVHGFNLDYQMHLAIAAMFYVQNAVRCMVDLGVKPEHYVRRPLATSMATLEPEEKESGSILVDMGDRATDIVTFKSGRLQEVVTLAVGGFDITKNIAVSMNLSCEIADDLKKRHGMAAIAGQKRTSRISPEPIPGDGNGVDLPRLNEIITAETVRILKHIKARMEFDRKPNIVVLTGGVANLLGIAPLAEQVLCLPVRIGLPDCSLGLQRTFLAPEYTTIVGLIFWYSDYLRESATPSFRENIARRFGVALRDLINSENS
jgi:cell division protein FtsA